MPAKRVGLARATMVSTALELLNEVGLDGLTVRRLAAELGVQSPALYWHFRSKQELLDEMSAAIQDAEPMGGPGSGEPWQDWVARRARQRRRLLLAHRDGARLLAGTRPGEATIRRFDQELAAMTGWGFSPAAALRAILSVNHYITGFVLQEQLQQHWHADRGGIPPPATDNSGGDFLAGNATPTLTAAFRDGGDPQGDEAFDYGLRMLIDGIAAALDRSRPAGS